MANLRLPYEKNNKVNQYSGKEKHVLDIHSDRFSTFDVLFVK